MCYALELPPRADGAHDHGSNAGWSEFSDSLVAASQEIEYDPDAAALRLDGLFERMLGAWYRVHGWHVPARGALLADLDQRAPELARRVRLALRAPDVSARLGHCRQVLRLLEASWMRDAVMVSEQHPCADQGARSVQRLSASAGEGWQAKGSVEHVR